MVFVSFILYLFFVWSCIWLYDFDARWMDGWMGEEKKDFSREFLVREARDLEEMLVQRPVQ